MDNFRADVRECLNSGKINVTYTGTKAVGTTKQETAKTPVFGDVVYQVYAEGKGWLDNIVNFNNVNSNGFAGWIGKPMLALRANVKGDAKEVGYLEYRVQKIGGSWYNWQRDRQLDKNGENFAGNCKNRYDGIQMRIVGAPGKHVKYRVHVIGIGWLDWITDYGSGNKGWAGTCRYASHTVQTGIP